MCTPRTNTINDCCRRNACFSHTNKTNKRCSCSHFLSLSRSSIHSIQSLCCAHPIQSAERDPVGVWIYSRKILKFKFTPTSTFNHHTPKMNIWFEGTFKRSREWDMKGYVPIAFAPSLLLCRHYTDVLVVSVCVSVILFVAHLLMFMHVERKRNRMQHQQQ